MNPRLFYSLFTAFLLFGAVCDAGAIWLLWRWVA